jgi:hypothetical protein
MNEPAQAGQKSSKTAKFGSALHPPASKPVSLAPLKFEEAMTALSRVVPQPHTRPKKPKAKKGSVAPGPHI